MFLALTEHVFSSDAQGYGSCGAQLTGFWAGNGLQGCAGLQNCRAAAQGRFCLRPGLHGGHSAECRAPGRSLGQEGIVADRPLLPRA